MIDPEIKQTAIEMAENFANKMRILELKLEETFGKGPFTRGLYWIVLLFNLSILLFVSMGAMLIKDLWPFAVLFAIGYYTAKYFGVIG